MASWNTMPVAVKFIVPRPAMAAPLAAAGFGPPSTSGTQAPGRSRLRADDVSSGRLRNGG